MKLAIALLAVALTVTALAADAKFKVICPQCFVTQKLAPAKLYTNGVATPSGRIPQCRASFACGNCKSNFTALINPSRPAKP